MANHYPELNPNKALIWRIIHRDNLDWVLNHGLYCGNSKIKAPSWISIGNQELIGKRASHPVLLSPGGMLNDYIPFYFTPFSPMLLNIKTGRGGIKKRANEEILILVSSIYQISDLGLPFLFTDGHAYCQCSNYYSSLNDLIKIDWSLLQRRDFKRDPDDPAKFERYQAEALIYQHLPVDGLRGIVCYTKELENCIEQMVQSYSLNLRVHARPGWYFT